MPGSGADKETVVIKILKGTAGNDVIDGSKGIETILGLNGNDTLNGSGGNDAIYGLVRLASIPSTAR